MLVMDFFGDGAFPVVQTVKWIFFITLQSVLFWGIFSVHVLAGLELTTVADHSIKLYLFALKICYKIYI